MMSRKRADALPAPERISAVDRLVDQIRELLAERGLIVGDALPTERELGDLFHASRNTVREALVVLRAYGLVETRPKVGAVVAGSHGAALERLFTFHNGVSSDSFRDVQGFRRILEIGVGDHIILHTDVAAFDALDEANDRLLEARTVGELAVADYSFHEAILALSGNRTTLAAFRLLRPVIEEIMRIGKAVRLVQADTHAMHADIIRALRQRDRIAYAYLMSRHLDYGLKFVPDQAGPDGPAPGPAD